MACSIFLFGSPFFSVFLTNKNQSFYAILVVCFGSLAWILERNRRLSCFWPAAFAFFIASVALLFLSTGFLNLPSDPLNPVRAIALDKVSQALHIVPIILLMTFLVREDLMNLYIARGDLRASLTFGLISFAGFAIASIVIELPSNELAGNLIRYLPWTLLFVFMNSLMEELWFRAIFLRKFDALIGRWPAIIVTSIVFGVSHMNVTYAFPGGGYLVVSSLDWAW